MNRELVDTRDTIFSLASGKLPSAVAIIRVSGAASFEIANKLISLPSYKPIGRQRGMFYGSAIDSNACAFDTVLLLTFVGSQSFTGEDSIEIQCHGSVAVVEKIERLLVINSARPAKRGEFSYRAFLNGSISSEALVDLSGVFKAPDETALNRVIEKADGILQKKLDGLRQHLMTLQAILDTAIDFSEEYPSVVSQAVEPLSLVIRECSALISQFERVFSGVSGRKVVLFGEPNAGKSSLFNVLLGRYRSIVHGDPGTTRDFIEQNIMIAGVPWKLVDTAGIRQTNLGDAEQIGVELAEENISSADVRVLVIDGSRQADLAEGLSAVSRRPNLTVFTKSDLCTGKPVSAIRGVRVSSVTGEGLEGLWSQITELCCANRIDQSEPLLNAVQLARLKQVIVELDSLAAALHIGTAPEYLSEQCRRIIMMLVAVTGEIEQEEVFGLIFSEFCIGK